MSQLQRLPVVGNEVTDSGYRFTVLTLEQRRVGRVMIERIPELPASVVTDALAIDNPGTDADESKPVN